MKGVVSARHDQLLSASCSSLVIWSVFASTVRFTTLAAWASALSSPFSMVGSPTTMSPAWLAVSYSAASWSSLRGRVPPPNHSGDDTDVRAVHPLDHVGLTVLLVDHGRVVLADHLVLVRLRARW
jgi:hypothetical protein